MYILIFLSKSIYTSIFYYFIVGVCAAGRLAIGTNYMNEFLPDSWRNLITSLGNVGNGTVLVFHSIYYNYNKDWVYLHLIGIIASFIIIFVIFTIPESPKYYYANRMFDQAREKLKIINRFNNTQISSEEIDNFIFDTEIEKDDSDNDPSD